ncbi:MAG: endonuclease/exonuclease/phosphatase family protein [Rhizobiaceae bacterium]|nr:endonuclease/exonuclease/phosphatase family protein [Rhizobiaceae bacterium]
MWKPALAESLHPLLRRFPHVVPMHTTDLAAGGGDALVASYNIHKCVGQDGLFSPPRIMSVIGEIGADIIALQEVDQRFGERVGLLDLAVLRDRCGLVPIPLRPTRKGHGWHGNLVLCREGVVKAARQMALPGVEPRGALIVDLELPVGPLRIIAAHLGLLRRSRALQVEAILSAVGADQHVPTLFLGDLNEWRLGARSSLRALEDSFHAPAPMLPSFPAGFPILALDRIMGNLPGLVARAAVHNTALARTASDHLPVKAWVHVVGASQGGEPPRPATSAQKTADPDFVPAGAFRP